MKTKKIYSSILLLTLSTICIAQEGETITKKENNTTQQIKTGELIAPPFSVQINNNKNLTEANKAKEDAKRDFPGITSYLKLNNKKYSITLGKYKTLQEAQQSLKIIKKKYPNATLISNQKD